MVIEHLNVSIFETFPKIDVPAVDALLSRELERNPVKLVVLDDDPTGVQTVHDVSVYTDWSPESMARGFAEKERLFYVLTNSRGFTVEQTTRCHQDAARAAAQAAKAAGVDYLIISRGDSTLRGHYPLETVLLMEEQARAGTPVDGEVLCPYFREGGRFTIGNVHYVRYGEELVPAGETEFAGDKTFAYTSSDLREYIAEKTAGEYPADRVTCISLEDLRAMDLDKIERQLLAVSGFGKIVVNAVEDCDLKVFCVALYRAMTKGKRFLFRTAASFVKVMGGVPDRPLLTRREMVREETDRSGIVVVGSHTKKTTTQLQQLLTVPGTEGIEFDSNLVLKGEAAFEAEIDRVVRRSETLMLQGKTPVCYTNRTLLTVENDTPERALSRSVKISQGVQALVGRLTVTPAFVIAKGGITSSDVGTKALAVKRARVMGQLRPGVPVWQTGAESRFPGIPYVIFPGNVGAESTLREAAEVLLDKTDCG